MEKLELFGQEFIRKIRDLSIEDYLMIKTGKMKSSDAKMVYELYALLSNSDTNKVDTIVVDIIGRALYNALRMFEESKNYTITDKRDHEDIVQLSDGLSGELYGENGWIEKYGKVR